MTAYAQETYDNNNLDHYYDFGTSKDITIYGEAPRDFTPESIEGNILYVLNGSLSDRQNFIETHLLEDSGFRRTGNAKYRKTALSEKAKSVLNGLTHAFSLGIVPATPFSEIDYERLPDGVYYSFESVFIKSKFTNISAEVILAMEIEYMLQIEFCNGILNKNNVNYYTEENIIKFEKLILELPEFSAGINQLKERYLNIELPKIMASFERYNNPGENYLRAMENLKDIFKRN